MIRTTSIVGALLLVCSLGLSSLSWAGPPPAIRETVGVCDPNYPTRCAAPDASGNLPVIVSGGTGGLTAHVQGWDGSAWQNINTNLVAGVYSLDVYDSQLFTAMGSPFQAGGSIGNASFASTVADGANVTLGAKADAAASTDTATASLIALFKRSLQSFTTLNANVTASIPAGSNTIGTVNAAGVTASGATLTENPLANGCRAALSTPTAVTDGQKVSMQCGAEGRVITKPYSIKENDLAGAANTTGTGATTIIAAQGASVKIYITGLQCFRTDGGTTLAYVTLNDSASTVEALPPTGGTNVPFNTPLVVAANTASTFTVSTALTTAYCDEQGYKGP